MKKAATEQENELQAKVEVEVGEKGEKAGKHKDGLTPSVQDDEKMRWKKKLGRRETSD